MAHDFRNILTVVSANLELAMSRAGDDPQLLKPLLAAQRAASRGEKAAEDLLVFARQQQLKLEMLDVNAVIRGVEDLLAGRLGDGIELRQHLGPDLRPALADQNQLERALLNLVVNARDAMPGGGVLSIETRNVVLGPAAIPPPQDVEPGPYAAITVRDTGTGVSPEVRERVFEPFFTTKPAGAGTGLGLSMVYGFARQSKGQVTIDSAEGKGTAVTIFLPQSASAVAKASFSS